MCTKYTYTQLKNYMQKKCQNIIVRLAQIQ